MLIGNKIFDEIQIGDEAELKRLCTWDDLLAFTQISGNHNPVHVSDTNGDGKKDGVLPGMFVGSLVSAVLGTILPGAGTMYRGQELQFHDYAHAGDELLVKVKVLEKTAATCGVKLAVKVLCGTDDRLLLSGTADVTAPTKKMTYNSKDLPGLVVQRHRHFEELLERAEPYDPLPTVVVAPEEPNSLGGALLARKHTLIEPILVGCAKKIAAAAEEIGADLTGIQMIDEPSHTRAAIQSVALVNEGTAGALMKGHLHTDQLLKPALDKAKGLRGRRRFTHVFVMDVPGLNHPLIVTDAAINIAPDLKTKVDITQNAIDVAQSIGIEEPKVGVLSAVEMVNPDIPSSLDAALLSKMSERGQITGGLVDGPLAMDNAVDLAAARTKGIVSKVAGRADILVAPNLDAANMLAKQLVYISHAEAAGLVLGARVPIVLNSRSDDDMARLASCAVAVLHYQRTFKGK